MNETAPQSSAPPGEPARSLRFSVLEGSAWSLMVAVTQSAIVTAYATMLGASDADFSLLTAMGTVATLGALAGAHWLGRTGSRRRVVMTAIWNRALWLVLGVLPLLSLPPRAAMIGLFAVLLVTSLLENVLGNAWLSWMGDLVPVGRRNRYFGVRNALCGAVHMTAAWSVGKAFDILHRHSVGRGMEERLVFSPFFLFAAAAGIATAHFMNRQWEPAGHGERPLAVGSMLRLPLRHPGFRRLLWFYVLWTLATGLSAPFWRPHMLINLRMDLSTIAVYTIISGLVSLSTQPLWGRIIDRTGSRPVVAICLAGVSGLPLLWLFARPDFLWVIWLDAALTGLLWPGFNLATFSLNLQTAPRDHRAAYLASISVVTGVMGFLANLLGGAIAVAASGFRFDLAGFPLVNYHVVFALSAIARITLLPLALRLHEDRSEPVGVLIHLVGDKVTLMLDTGRQRGLALVRRFRRRGR